MNFKEYIKEERLDEVLITLGNKRPNFGQVVIMAGGAGCFDGRTEVCVDSGYKKISEIEVGEQVLSFNEKTKVKEYKEVQNIFKHQPQKEMLEIELSSEKIVCTKDHKFLVGSSWVEAKDLLGLELETMKVIKIKRLPKQVTYDIEVADNHNYCITKNDIVVHNSGKGYVIDKLLSIQGKIFDVDDVKRWIVSPKTLKLNKKILDRFNVDVTKLNLKVPEDVALLHQINKEMGISKKEQDNFIKSHRNPETLPNIIFDVTMRSISKMENLVDTVVTAGYKKENIHIVWVVQELDQAIKQNFSRDRVVPQDILLQTHQLVSATMAQLLQGKTLQGYIGGDVWLVFNKRFVDSAMEFAKDLDPDYGGNDDRKGSWVKDALLFKVKKQGKGMMSFQDIPTMFIDRIKKYIPRSTVKAWGG